VVPVSDEAYFRRFRFSGDDLPEVEAEIASDRAVLAAAGPESESPEVLAALVGLGEILIPLDREAEAVTHLEQALAIARRAGNQDREISALLHLATARQYLGERDVAQELFQAGLDAADRYGVTRQRHFLLHHRGRCYAEQGQIPEARECLQRALALRRQLGDPRFIASSRDALADLDQLSR
jgi:HTH-type transcriptional regulator, pleiotropic regulator of extracellular virulence genes